MAEKTLMARLLDAGYPCEEMYHHASDLYIFVNGISKPVVEEFYREQGMSRAWCAPIFQDRLTGQLMYDCAFQYSGNALGVTA